MITKESMTIHKDNAFINIKYIRNNAWRNYHGVKAYFKFNKSDITVHTNNDDIFVLSNPEILDNDINYIIDRLEFKTKLPKDIKIGDIVLLKVS